MRDVTVKPRPVMVQASQRMPDGTTAAVWVTIGQAWTMTDGSVRIHLDALPLNGALQVGPPEV